MMMYPSNPDQPVFIDSHMKQIRYVIDGAIVCGEGVHLVIGCMIHYLSEYHVG